MAPRKGKGKLTERLSASCMVRVPASESKAAIGGTDVVETVPAKAVKTKFVVADRSEVPVVHGHVTKTATQVKLVAAYEPKSILHGLSTEQGNDDNKIFGLAQPEAVMVMTITDKEAAAAFVPGNAFALTFTPLD